MTLQPYSYCFLRYHHDIASGEFANVGVLIWAPDSSFLSFRYSDRISRLSEFFKGFHSTDYRSYLSSLDTSFKDLACEVEEGLSSLPLEKRMETARELAVKILPLDSSSMQWSKSRGGLTESPEIEVERLFQEYIGKHQKHYKNTGRDNQTVFQTVYKSAFEKSLKISGKFSEYESKSPLVPITFPKAWKNGSMHAYDAVSFDLANSDSIRDKACRISTQSRLVMGADDVKLTYLLGAPKKELNKHYRNAIEIIEGESGAKVVEEEESEEFAKELEKKVLQVA